MIEKIKKKLIALLQSFCNLLHSVFVEKNCHSLPVVPVVTLKANIKTSGRDENGAWNLVFE